MQKNIRNFCIISHIDHGKSTLADRFLELTETVPPEKMQPQFLDAMALERERGITIKMQPVRMLYTLNLQSYILNLIDTPGHIDFSYEVSRGLAAVEGAILLVDVTKGIQAQTLHNLAQAQKQGLVIIPALNKIDLLPSPRDEDVEAELSKVKEELQDLLGNKEEVLEISAKNGTNVKQLLEQVIKKVPPPEGREELPLRALIFDSQYDPYKGVLAFVRLSEGSLKQGQEIYLLQKEQRGVAKEIGYFTPEFKPQAELKAGEIGYIATGIKEPGKVRVGETITSFPLPNKGKGISPLPGYKEPKPVVFASLYPENIKDFARLQRALFQLQLTDPAFNFTPERKTALGRGFQGSFLGSLHAEIVTERLQREFGFELIVSRPQVVYRMKKQQRGKSPAVYKMIFTPQDFPENLQGVEVEERWVKVEVLTPQKFLGPVLKLMEGFESRHLETRSLGEKRLLLVYEMPLREMMAGFYDKLKSVSQGYASLNYEIGEWREADLVKLEIFIAGKKEELFSQIVPRDKAFEEGKKTVRKLKEILPPQQFALALQAKVSGKIIARETISARRKDVLAPLYGGDYTRKRKLLEKQKKGKKRLKEVGRVRIPPKVYLAMLKD